MATSRKASSRKPARPTSASSYRQKNQELTELPSGAFAKLRRPGMERFLGAGYLPDTLRSEMEKQIASASGKKASSGIAELAGKLSVEDMAEWMNAMDRIVCEVFVEPKVVWHKRPVMAQAEGQPAAVMTDAAGKPKYEDIPDEDRDEEALYTDELDMEDKQFCFQYGVGGTTDLTRFRATAASLVDDLSASAAVAVSAERGAVSDGGSGEHVAEPLER